MTGHDGGTDHTGDLCVTFSAALPPRSADSTVLRYNRQLRNEFLSRTASCSCMLRREQSRPHWPVSELFLTGAKRASVPT